MKQDSFKDFVMDQLGELDLLVCRPMFGGFGLYAREKFFGIIFDGKLYFKVSEKTVGEYTIAGMEPFHPKGKQTMKKYYEVPASVVEDADELRTWASQAVEV
jgi:DNA transformation protein